MLREELQKKKLKVRVGKRAWDFEKRLASSEESEVAKKC